ncbi:MAG: cyclic pyranopterin monophosphate synthase MoaC [Chloroflexi bacterium]|nr:cyclic pyranopterin monophosphate synthase MoaC [Chloroflexota bacterium]
MASDDKLTHLDADGQVSMVDVGAKPVSDRIAIASGSVVMKAETLAMIRDGNLKKGDLLGAARIAGIMGAKRTADLIPLCHPIALEKIAVDLELDGSNNAVNIVATVKTSGVTGVEMEALTAVSVAALTIYDMAKAVDRDMRLTNIRLLEKRGGARGDFRVTQPPGV